MKIKFNTDDDLLLNESLKLRMLTIIVRSVFEEEGNFYLQSYLDGCLYELQKCCSTKKLMFQKELTLVKQVYQKNACVVIIGILKMLDLDFNHMFAINVTMY